MDGYGSYFDEPTIAELSYLTSDRAFWAQLLCEDFSLIVLGVQPGDNPEVAGPQQALP